MQWFSGVREALAGLLFRKRVEREMDEELTFHIEEHAAALVRAGANPAEARRAATLRFGGVERLKDEWRDARGTTGLEAFAHDVRHAGRTLRLHPGFTLLVVLTLAVGIGANTAIMSLAERVLLRPVPGVQAPEELVTFTFAPERFPGAYFWFAHADYLDLADALGPGRMTTTSVVHSHVMLPGSERAVRLRGEVVAGDYWQVLGVAPQLGRTDADMAETNVMVLSHAYWQEAFGGARDAVGRTLLVNGTSFTIVGVAPPHFEGPDLEQGTKFWVPVRAHAAIQPGREFDIDTDRENTFWGRAIARLPAGMTVEQAVTRVNGAIDAIKAEHANSSLRSFRAAGDPGIGTSTVMRERLANTLRILFAVVVGLLILACANAANVLLARAAQREHEWNVRRALGASRFRLLRQILTEGMLLAGVAGGAGVAMAMLFLRAVEGQRLLDWMPPLENVQLNTRVLAFTLGVATLTGLVFAVLPALLTSRQVDTRLRSGARTIAGRSRLRSALVTVQIALSLALLVTAGLLLDTTRALLDTELGFDPDNVVEVSLSPGTNGYDEARRNALFQQLRTEALGLPGVQSAGYASMPVFGNMRGGQRLKTATTEGDGISAGQVPIGAAFFATIGIEIVEGREFRPEEVYRRAEDAGVAILSRRLARELFPQSSPLGQAVSGWDGKPMMVVGVVEDARIYSPQDAPGPMIYTPIGQDWAATYGTLYVRSDRPAATLAALEQIQARIDPAVPLSSAQTLADARDRTLGEELLLARMSLLFSLLALFLAAVGVYGLIAFDVSTRQRELGVRLVLGAQPHEVRSMMLGQSLRLAVIGITLGVLLASQLTRVVESRLWGVTTLDAQVYITAILTLVFAAAAAAYLPAWRAGRIDPARSINT